MSAVALKKDYDTHTICDALLLSRGTFYNHVFRNKKENAWFLLRDAELKDKITDVFMQSECRYGSEKIAAVLKSEGIAVSKRKVADIMSELGFRSKTLGAKAGFVHMTRQEYDRIRQKFTAAAPNLFWLSDITQHRVKGKTHHICAVLDMFSRRIVACRTSHRPSTHLVKMTLKEALELRKPEPGIVFHSDRGPAFRSKAILDYAKENGIALSLSRPHTPYDNSPMERFFKTLKTEELYRHYYRSEREFKASLFKFIRFYNEERPHFSNKYRTPAQAEADLETINRQIPTNAQSQGL